MKNYFLQFRILDTGGRVMSNFFIQVLRGEPITICCGSKQAPLFYLDDLIESFERLMRMPNDFIRPFNLSLGEFIIVKLVEKIKAQTGSKSEHINKPLPTNHIKQR